MEEDRKYLIISYCTCVFAVVAFALYAVGRYTYTLVKTKHDLSTEQFITARGTQGRWRIAYSFFASAVGAWCITAPASFAYYTGIVGLAMYAFASGLPVLLIALFGCKIQKMHPDVLSISDFAGKRFGPVFRTVVVLVCLFNMSIAMLAEYITVGTLFESFVGSVNYPSVILVGILTMIYTAYGGLSISIITDQLQAILSILFIAVLTIYVAVTFREPLEKPVPEFLGPNENGYSAIFSMPCSLLAATVFSEAMWQKVWAASDRKSVIFGGTFGFIFITLAVFLLGFGGWLAGWANLIYFDDEGNYVTDPNLYLLQVFKAEAGDGSGMEPARVRSWVGVVTLILAVTMNESAIDSLQSGLTASITSHFLKDQHVGWSRAVVFIINIPLIVISLQGYPILSLYVISNMLTSCCFLPVLAGLFESTRKWASESAAIFGCVGAILTTCAYGAGRWCAGGYGRFWEPEFNMTPPQDFESNSECISYGVWYAWYGNSSYDWDYFLVASMSSVASMLVWIAVAQAIKALTGWEGPGISGILKYIPGFQFITGGGVGVDLLSKATFGRWQYNPDTGATQGGKAEVYAAKDAELAAFKDAAAGKPTNVAVADSSTPQPAA